MTKFVALWFTSARFLVLVNTYPLVQNIQPYPITNYEHNVYRLPYSEAFVIQPSNNNHYPQQHSVQTLPPYQTLQVPALTGQFSNIDWNKILLNPPMGNHHNIINPNVVVQNRHDEDVQTYLPSYNTGGAVNNYIVVPSDYLKLNETVAKQATTKRLRNKENKSRERPKQRNEMVVNDNRFHNQGVILGNNKAQLKEKQKAEQSWNFNTNNIKCFTPADVLGNEKYQPERIHYKNEEIKKQCHRENINKNLKSSTHFTNKNGKQAHSNMKRNKVKKKPMENRHKETTANISTRNKRPKKINKGKKASKACKYVNRDELPVWENKMVEFNEQDIEDMLLFNLLQQGCTNSENRQTRNSKADTAIKDFRNMYPDLSDDLSKSLTWYMNDFFSPQSLQYAPSFNALQGNMYGNMYPFDLTQMYQIPQYSDADVNKSKGNPEKNKKTKRKKKKKKNSKSKTRKENESNSDNSKSSTNSELISEINPSEKNSDVPEASTQVLKTITQTQEANIQTSMTIANSPENTSHMSHKNTHTTPSWADLITSQFSENKPLEMASPTTKPSTTGTTFTELTTLMDKVIEHFQEPFQRKEEKPEEKDKTIFTGSITSTDKLIEYIAEPIQRKEEMPEEKDKTAGTIFTESITSTDKVIEYFKEPIQLKEEMCEEKGFKTFNKNRLCQNERSEELYETQIPNSVTISEYEEKVNNDISTLNSLMFNQLPKFTSADFFNTFMKDYYPDFREDNHAYLVSDEEIELRDIHDRYFYLTDKIIDSREIDSPEQENEMSNKRVLYSEENNMSILKNTEESQEIVFKTPPGLDVPDFITRKINKDNQDSSEVYYQHSLEDFDRFNLDIFDDKTDTQFEIAKATDDNKSGLLVETVYAKSKVVKYGQVQEAFKPEAESDFPKDVSNNNDGEKTVIIAKSLRPEEYW